MSSFSKVCWECKTNTSDLKNGFIKAWLLEKCFVETAELKKKHLVLMWNNCTS